MFLHVVASAEFGGQDEMPRKAALEAALRRPLASFAGELLYGTPQARAAALMSSLLEGGQRRLAVLAGAWWLEKEGYRLEVPPDGLHAILTGEVDEIAQWLKENAVRLER